MTLNLPAALHCPQPHVPLHYHFHKKGPVIAPFLLLALHLEVSPFFFPPSAPFLLLLLSPSLSRPTLLCKLFFETRDALYEYVCALCVCEFSILVLIKVQHISKAYQGNIPAHLFHLVATNGPKRESCVSAGGPETPVTFDLTLHGGRVCS